MEHKYKSVEWYEDRLKEFQMAQALILTFYREYEDYMSKDLTEKYINYFGITRLTEGKIQNEDISTFL